MGTFHVDVAAGGRVLVPRGELSTTTAADLRAAVRARLLDRTDVLVDLGGLRVCTPEAVHAFSEALADAGGWPRARLVLFNADAVTTALLHAQRVPLLVPVAADLAAAGPRLAHRPDRVARRTVLPAGLPAPAHARTFVASACADWAVAGRFPDAPLVATELVSNAVVHGRRPFVLVVALDRHGLHVAVRDGSSTGVAAIRADPAGGRGLHLVSELTLAWGVTAHPDGKTVWSVLRSR
ncbi:MAG: ATP-binding protein [Pseudonocardia sp.]